MMNFVNWGFGTNTDPSFDASAMLQPLPYYRHQPSSITQYETNPDTDTSNQRHRQPQPTHTVYWSRNPGKKGSSNAAAKQKSPLALLEAEQAALRQRKVNIARFGSTWLRPAGIPKTYQAMMDEAAEREEQEAQARREAAAAEEHRAAREAEAQGVAAAVATRAGATPRLPRESGNGPLEGFGGEGAMDVDLDDDVPEGDVVEYDDEEDEPDEDQIHVSSPVEAGSYEHTDSDFEDSDDEDDDDENEDEDPDESSEDGRIRESIEEHLARNPQVIGNVPPENALHPPRILDGATGRFVHSIEGTSEFMPVENPEESSFLDSPAAVRERELDRRDEMLARGGQL